MQQEIQDIINKNLPKAVSEQLQERLIELEQIECDSDIRENALTIAYSVSKGLRKDIEELETLQLTNERLDEREQEITQRERDLEITILTIKLKEADQRNNNTFNLVNTLFSRENIRKTITDSTFIQERHDNNGNFVPCYTKNDIKEELIVKE